MAAKLIVALLTAMPMLSPYWCHPAQVEACECGACGHVQSEYRQVLSYDGSEWVPVCDECFVLFATESTAHRMLCEQEATGL